MNGTASLRQPCSTFTQQSLVCSQVRVQTSARGQ
jgi:hypothetical protein